MIWSFVKQILFGKICKVSVRVGKVTRHVNIYMDVSSVYSVVW